MIPGRLTGRQGGKRQQWGINTCLPFMMAFLEKKKKTTSVMLIHSAWRQRLRQESQIQMTWCLLYLCLSSLTFGWRWLLGLEGDVQLRRLSISFFSFVSCCHVGPPPRLQSEIRSFHVPTARRFDLEQQCFICRCTFYEVGFSGKSSAELLSTRPFLGCFFERGKR